MFSAWWSSVFARISWSKSPPTIGTELTAATGGTRRSRSGAMSPRRAASCSGRSSTEAGKTSETCFAISCSVAVMPMKMGSGNERIAAEVFSPSAVCASSQMMSWYTSRSIESTWRANHAYVWIVSGAVFGRFPPVRIDVGEAVAVALRREVARELGDEQAAVREDQDAERAGRLDEAGGGDRLARRGRVAEAVAAARAGIVLRLRLLRKFGVLDLDDERRVFVLVLLGELLGGRPRGRCRCRSPARRTSGSRR